MNGPIRTPWLDDGYRGIWYYNQPSDDEYRYKYSGGFATYPQQITPFAVYCGEANRTFFCYGGAPADKNELVHAVSYFDHAAGTVPRPRILLNKGTDDAHDNPAISVDDAGHLWIFSNAHGTSRPSWIHRSTRPYDIDEFEQVLETNFSYSQPWFLPGQGFLFLQTRYSAEGHRRLFRQASPDGRTWSEPQMVAYFGKGHYQTSSPCGRKVGTAFNYHPEPVGLNARTNLYYLETDDLGETWRNAAGEAVSVPLRHPRNPALVRDYESEGLLVYLKEANHDAAGRPVLLYLTSSGYESGPKNDPRTWHTARWTGTEWDVRKVTTSDSNYDFGSLYVEADGTWRVIAPTEPGPQAYNPGGEVAMWTSADQGMTWRKEHVLTWDSPRNHTYVRRPLNAHPDFYALWADGDARQPSESRLYFADRSGSGVWRLPVSMASDFAEPEVVWRT